MTIPKNILLTDFFSLNVRCNQGLEHGKGLLVWMHPPVHRVLGWVTGSSLLNMTRSVWRLDQVKKLNNSEIFVKGTPSISDQITLDRLPTLINANLLNNKGERLASIVDIVFELSTGSILYYVVSRSNPKIPGTSRWSLKITQIKDQQPGAVLSNLDNLGELPLLRASVREDFMNKSREFRSQLKEMTDIASTKIEGWLDESPWEENTYETNHKNLDNWVDNPYNENSKTLSDYDEIPSKRDNDPWI